MDPHTLAKGRRELIEQDFELDRIRKPSGGRKLGEKPPAVIARIEELLQHDTAGDPMSGIKWSRRTRSNIFLATGQFGERRLL